MRSINRVEILGNLTRDPELKYTQSGSAICKGGIALNRSYKTKDSDEWKEVVTFVDLTFWGKTAEQFASLKKGERVYVEGRLDLSSWETKDGQKRSKLEVTGTDFFPARALSISPSESSEGGQVTDDSKGGEEDDIPF